MTRRLDLEDDRPLPKHSSLRLISLSAVCRMTARSRSSIYRDVERGEFPVPLKTGPKSNAWLYSEVQEWITNLARRKADGAA